jgi:dCTP deaminase
VYLVPLLEQPEAAGQNAARHGRIPKSTTGRLDVFTRVVTDLNAGFDEIRAGYRGPSISGSRAALVRRQSPHRPVAESDSVRARRRDGQRRVRCKTLHRKSIRCSITTARPERTLEQGEFRARARALPAHRPQGKCDRTGARIIGYRAKKNSHVIDLAKVGHYRAHSTSGNR